MPPIPLYLKINGLHTDANDNPPHITEVSTTEIKFNENTYEFAKIFGGSTTAYPELIDDKSSSCVVLVGPTGSGKTTLLKQLIAAKVKNFETQAFISSFEITKLRKINDLVDSASEFKKLQLSSLESTLKRAKYTPDALKLIMSRRSTQPTESHPNSSQNASITQLIVNHKNVSKADDLISNFISKNQKLKVVLNLDPYGDSAFIDSSLKDVSDFVKIFEPPANSPVNSLAKTNNDTVTKQVRRVPSYTRPTLSSSRHSPKNLSKRSRINSNSPDKMTLSKRVRLKNSPLSQSVDSNPFIEKNSKIYLKNLASRTSSTDTLTDSDSHHDCCLQIETLQNEKRVLHKKYVDSIKDLKQDFLAFKQEAAGIINVLNDLDAQLSELKQKQIDLEIPKMTKSRNWLQFTKELIAESESKQQVEEELENLKTIHAKDSVRILELETQLSDAAKEKSESDYKLTDTSEIVNDLKSQIETLKANLNKSEEEREIQNKKLDQVSELKELKELKVEELSNNLSKLQQELHRKEIESNEQLEKLHGVSADKEKSLQQSIEQSKIYINSLKDQNAKTDRNWEIKYGTLEQNQQKLVEEHLANRQRDQLEIEKLVKSKTELEADNQALKNQLTEISKQFSTLGVESSELKKQLEETQIKYDQAEIELNQSHEKFVNELKNEHEKQVKETKDQTIKEMEEKHQQAIKEIEDSHNENIKEINNEHENKAKCIIDSLNEEIEELTSQLKNAESEKNTLQSLKLEYENEIIAYKSKIDQLEKESAENLKDYEAKLQSMKFDLESDLAIEKQLRKDDGQDFENQIEKLNQLELEDTKAKLEEKSTTQNGMKSLDNSLTKKHAAVVAELSGKITNGDADIDGDNEPLDGNEDGTIWRLHHPSIKETFYNHY
ncbi:Archaeal ATPase family protein [Candida albicans]|uniref:Archaeal ATPase family protein n=1 Tax=Candida albicans TaxID=5476 RepID=A0A8H6F3S2_CANAX|nr:Archaeal ATPase family protein [Candida albicans]